MNGLAALRLAQQQLVASRHRSPESVVAWLGGVQAQDYAGAKWSIGLRLPGATDADVERAVADGAIVRTWAMRGTLHFLAARDVHWLVPTLAPGLIARNRRRYEQLGLVGDVFARSNRVIAEALAGGNRLTRAELSRALAQAGIAADGQRAPYLLQRASLDGIACHGPNRDGEPTYVLQRAWVPRGTMLGRDEAMAELANRYFASHGPATWRDFAWWSGLSAGEVRAARDRVESGLIRRIVDGVELWDGSAPNPAVARVTRRSVGHLLPPFDELLLGYKDRSATLKRDDAKRVNAGGGMPKATVAIDGEVVGTWSRTVRAETWHLTIAPFRTLDGHQRRLLEEAADRLGAFVGTRVVVA